MKDNEFDLIARNAVATDPEQSERVWRQSLPVRRSWVPSYFEIALVTAVGCLALMLLSGPTPKAIPTQLVTQSTVRRAVNPFESSMIAVNRIAGPSTMP